MATYKYLLDKYGLSISWGDASKETGIYWERIQKLCRSGEINAKKVGSRWVLTTRALADYIDNRPVARETEKAISFEKRGSSHKYVTPF